MRPAKTVWRGVVVLLAAALGLLLTGCAQRPGIVPFDLVENDGTTVVVECNVVNSVIDAVQTLQNETAPGERAALRQWGLDPDNRDQIDDVLAALRSRAESKDCNASAGPSQEPTSRPPVGPGQGPTAEQPEDDPSSPATRSPGSVPTQSGVDEGNAQTGETQVGTNDDETVDIPWVSGVTVNNGDTRNSETMPSIDKLLPGCGVLETWRDLLDCANANDASWFAAAVDGFAPRSGFDWNDVATWANAKTADGKVPEQRVIMLTGTMTSLTDAEANAAVAELTDDATLQVIRLNESGFTNTWRAPGEAPGLEAFIDYGNQVRVTLAPLILDANGHVVGFNADIMWSGVFVDCINVHWRDKYIPVTPTAPVCPTGTALAGQPLPSNGYAGCNPAPAPDVPVDVDVPGDTNPPGGDTYVPPPGGNVPKNPSQGAAQNGNNLPAGNGGAAGMTATAPAPPAVVQEPTSVFVPPPPPPPAVVAPPATAPAPEPIAPPPPPPAPAPEQPAQPPAYTGMPQMP